MEIMVVLFVFLITGDNQQCTICINFQKQGDKSNECFGVKDKYVQACTQSCLKIKLRRTLKTLLLCSQKRCKFLFTFLYLCPPTQTQLQASNNHLTRLFYIL